MKRDQAGNVRMVIAGAGNVGTHLARAFQQKGMHICQVFSRTEQSARRLADEMACAYTCAPDEIDQSAGVLLLALNDSALLPFLNKAGSFSNLVLHTAGSMPLEILQPFSSQTAVLYPLQSISRELPLDFSSVPFLMEASDPNSLADVQYLASLLTRVTKLCSSSERLSYHLAAVFCNNFSNHMMSLAEVWLNSRGLPFGPMRALIEETARKALELGPFTAQTGPAVRGNNELLEQHRDLLSNFPDSQKIYTFVSESIQQLHYHKKPTGK